MRIEYDWSRVQFSGGVTMFWNLIGTANFQAAEVTVWTRGSCQVISPTAWERGYMCTCVYMYKISILHVWVHMCVCVCTHLYYMYMCVHIYTAVYTCVLHVCRKVVLTSSPYSHTPRTCKSTAKLFFFLLHMASTTQFSIFARPRRGGGYKTWTLDSGLDRGLDSGLKNGLDI